MHTPPNLLHESPELAGSIGFAGGWEARRGQDFPLHRHSHWEFVYYLAGHIRCHHDADTFTGEPGLLWLTPPGVDHAEIALTGYRNIYVSVHLPAGTTLPRHVLDDADRSLERVFRSILAECRTERPRRAARLSLLLQEVLLLVARASETPAASAAEALVARAERLLDDAYADPVTVADLARELAVSASTLRAHFQTVRGYSPKAYLIRARVAHATQFLRGSDLTLDAIAACCGFHSASHLSRHFKAETGVAPGHLRRQGG